ncbi:hypothetical protein OQA88_10678 [Cercophora sp. LCS_1]
MAIFSKKDAASSFPIDEATPFVPTKAVYIQEATEFALSITITDVTASVATHLSPDIQPSLLEGAKSAASTSSPTIKLTRPNRLSRSWTATNPSGATVADLSNPIWSLGKWIIKFPANSPHSEHDIQLRPASAASRADEFVKDSVPFFWDLIDGRKLIKLYRALDGKKVEVARFLGENVRAQEGVLLVGEGVDDVVAVLTVFGALNRLESFRA